MQQRIVARVRIRADDEPVEGECIDEVIDVMFCVTAGYLLSKQTSDVDDVPARLRLVLAGGRQASRLDGVLLMYSEPFALRILASVEPGDDECALTVEFGHFCRGDRKPDRSSQPHREVLAQVLVSERWDCGLQDMGRWHLSSRRSPPRARASEGELGLRTGETELTLCARSGPGCRVGGNLAQPVTYLLVSDPLKPAN